MKSDKRCSGTRIGSEKWRRKTRVLMLRDQKFLTVVRSVFCVCSMALYGHVYNRHYRKRCALYIKVVLSDYFSSSFHLFVLCYLLNLLKCKFWSTNGQHFGIQVYDHWFALSPVHQKHVGMYACLGEGHYRHFWCRCWPCLKRFTSTSFFTFWFLASLCWMVN